MAKTSISPKKKPCKGTHQETKGLGCGKPTFYRKLGLGTKCGCYAKFLYTTPAGKERVKRSTLKATKIRRGFEKFKEDENEIRLLNWLHINTRNACHEYVKLRDKGRPCISCQKPYSSNFQAGHYYKAELFSNLRFHEFNVNGQCPVCNMYKDGNESEYRVHLPKRIGSENFEKLRMLSAEYKQDDFKWDRETLTQIRKDYFDKTKKLKRQSGE